MKRTSESCKFPSFRPKIQRKPTNIDTTNTHDSAHDLPLENPASLQNDVSKKIQAKLRMRRTTGSQKKISRETADPFNYSQKQLQDADPLEEYEEKINYLWENSQQVAELLQSFTETVNPQQMKKLLLRERAFLQCYSADHGIEQAVVGRLKKIVERIRAQKRCQQQQLLLGRKFQERMMKLSEMLKPRY